MSIPDRLVWGKVPDEYQQADFRRKVAKTVTSMRPPLPPAYATDLVNNIMEMVEDWEWWQMRWYGQWDEWEQR